MSSAAPDSQTTGSPEPYRQKSEPLPLWANIQAMRSLTPMPGITMWPLAGSNLMINFVRIEPGAMVPLHQHPHEQGGTVLEGAVTMTIESETRELRAGDVYIAPPNAMHGATSLDGCLLLDIFSPPREDYLPLPE